MQALDKQIATGQTFARPSVTPSQVADFYTRSNPPGGGSSNFGIMLERAALSAHSSETCPSCDGMGFREISAEEVILRTRRIARETDPMRLKELRASLNTESTCKVCKGIGFVDPGRGRHDPYYVTKRCYRCHGTGEIYDEDNGDQCPRCLGDMSTVPVTVNETGCTKNGRVPKRESGPDDSLRTEDSFDSGGVDEQAVVDHGRVSRVVHRLRESDPASAQALEAYHGQDGDRAAATRWGRSLSIWPLTPAGKEMALQGAERSRRGHGFLLHPVDLIASERNAESLSTTADLMRRSLIRKADIAARTLLDRMNRALHAASAE